MKRVLITGANSYIGDSVKDYLNKEPDKYQVDVLDTMGYAPNPNDFKNYDVVFCVTGIAHIKETKKNRHLYYDVNRDLVVNIARAAKDGGVRQFILLSSMSVYGIATGHITKKTHVNPNNSYGDSKAQADSLIFNLANDSFKFACLRPPMVYGNGCKGNYQRLRSFALKSYLFPNYKNERSMIFIDNLSEFVEQCIDEEKSGLFFPQNADYVCTSELVRLIAGEHGKKIIFTRLFNPLIEIMRINSVKKVFGNLTYERTDVVSKYDLAQSVELSENRMAGCNQNL